MHHVTLIDVISPRTAPCCAAVLALIATLTMSGCGEDYNDSETAEWLRVAGHFDETPEQVNCIDEAMHALLSQDELATWMAQDPETVTIMELQSLPHAIDIADRCRHL